MWARALEDVGMEEADIKWSWVSSQIQSRYLPVDQLHVLLAGAAGSEECRMKTEHE